MVLFGLKQKSVDDKVFEKPDELKRNCSICQDNWEET